MTPAVRTAILSGLLLIVWSVVTYFLSESRSFTAFIPAGFGGLLALCGLIGRSEGARKHAMHAAAMVGLLGVLGGFGMGLRKVFSEPGMAAYSQLFLGIVCLVFLIVCIRSFHRRPTRSLRLRPVQ
jgi:hypothetical protein